MVRRIAYVEDNDTFRESFAHRLRDEGFSVSTYCCKDEAIAALRQDLPDLALLDICEVGNRDAGYQLCAEIRRMSGEIPIIFLTNRQDEIDKISGFRLGADDYISKESSPEYVVIRIEALFRRLEALREAGQARSANGGSRELELDEVYSTVHWHGELVDMPLTQFWILKELCLHPGEVRSHRDLMKAANVIVEPNTIAAHVKAIRRAFSEQDAAFHCIKTERGRGYRWIED